MSRSESAELPFLRVRSHQPHPTNARKPPSKQRRFPQYRGKHCAKRLTKALRIEPKQDATGSLHSVVFSFLPYAPSRQKEIHNLWKAQAVHSDTSQTSYFRLQFGQRGWTGMAIKKRRRTPPPPKPTRSKAQLPSLSKTEADLLWHMAHRYQL